jgi:hypothetical protein
MPTRQSGAVPALSQDIFNLTPQDPPRMYARETTADGLTKHSRHCQALFSRRDWKCHRCCELMIEAAPRDGWQHEYFSRKMGQVQRKLDFEFETNH